MIFIDWFGLDVIDVIELGENVVFIMVNNN